MPKTKAEVEKSKKKIEDATFGLKNKNKSKKVQAFVAAYKSQEHKNAELRAVSGKTPEQIADMKMKKMLKEKEAVEAELARLARPLIKQAPVPAGVDPKSILCEFFKAGVCEKGVKCKFGHDLALGRKSAKVSLYEDRSGGGGDKSTDVQADWDQEKLEAVVKTKSGIAFADNKTDIVCKYFLDAIEKEQYGWFWQCADGNTCKYKHSLPPGFVYKSKKARDAEAALAAALEKEVDITELIEAARARLPAGGTPVTEETFAKWKAARDIRVAAEAKARAEEEVKKAGGAAKDGRVLSGRALFSYDASLFVDDADASAEVFAVGEAEEEEEEEEGGGEGGAAAAARDEEEEGGDEEDDDEDEEEGEEEGEEEEEEEEGEDGEECAAAGGGGPPVPPR